MEIKNPYATLNFLLINSTTTSQQNLLMVNEILFNID